MYLKDKKKIFNIRLSEEEYKMLCDGAEELNLSKAQYVRCIIKSYDCHKRAEPEHTCEGGATHTM